MAMSEPSFIDDLHGSYRGGGSLRNFLVGVSTFPGVSKIRHGESFVYVEVSVGGRNIGYFTVKISLDSGNIYYSTEGCHYHSCSMFSNISPIYDHYDMMGAFTKFIQDVQSTDKQEAEGLVRAWEQNQSMITSKSGAIKGQKLALYSKIPTAALHSLAERYGYGEWKYGDARNWEKGLPWTSHVDAMMRHLMAWQGGEDLDPDCPFKSSHISAVMYHASALEHYMANEEVYSEYDDRVKYGAPIPTDMEALREG